MSSPRVVGLGMAVLDILVRLKEMPTWVRGAQLSAAAIDGGGPVATAMATVSRLGVLAGIVATYGSDRLGEIKMETLVENGLDVSHMVRRPGPENQAVLVSVHEETGERLFSKMHSFSDEPLTVDEIDREYITGADVLHLDGCHPDAALQAAEWMHEAGKTVVLDGSKTDGAVTGPMRELVRRTDVLISGSGFARGLTGLDGIWAAGATILEMGPRIFVQTEGEAGSYTVTPTEQFHTPAFEIQVVDTTGAGDVFHGAYIVGLLRGWDARQAAQFSTAVSAMKCTKLGGRAGIPTFEATLAFLGERGIDLE